MTIKPARPRLALSIGVIGHRPNRLPEAARAGVETRIDALLATLRQAMDAAHARYAGVLSQAPSSLTMISALAEGADRMAARSALRNGLALDVPLPFAIDDYEKDFADAASRAEYRSLLDQAARCLVLPGNYYAARRDYEPVGHAILDHADIIVAVWDGGASGGRGGTTELIERAAAMDLPILHIDAADAEPPRLLWAGLADHPVSGAKLDDIPSAPPAEVLGTLVDNIVRPPIERAEQDKLVRFLDDRWRRLNWRIEMPLTLAMFGLRRFRRTDFLAPAPSVVRREIDAVVPSSPPDSADPNARHFYTVADAYGAADSLATRYAQKFRGASVTTFFFSALAVVVAALALVGQQLFDWEDWPLATLQIALVALVLVNTAIVRRHDWHGRWRESREVAERLRVAIPLWLLGETAEDATGAEPNWPAWYARAHLRALGLWSGSLDRPRLEAVRKALIALVDGQCAYHTGTAALMVRIEHRLLTIGNVLFALTLLLGAVALVIALLGIDLPFSWNYVLVGITAALPALGSATFGIRLIGDFEGAAERSSRTAAHLGAIGQALRGDRPDLAVLRSRANALADAMLGDVSHWRMATETRKLVAPV